MSSPSGCWDAEVVKLKSKATEMTRAILSASLYRHEATILYHSYVLPSLRYSLAVTYIPQEKLKQIQTPVTRACARAMGLPATFPDAVLYGPQQFGGKDLKDLFTIRGSDSIKMLFQSFRSERSQRKKIMVTLQSFQLFAGIESPILEDATQELSYLPDGWIPGVREFLHSIGGSIRIQGLRHTPVRQHDAHIMDLLLPHYSGPALRNLNNCRLFLQVTLLSEIMTEDGGIHEDIAQGRRPSDSESTLIWPRQANPDRATWWIWINAMKYLYAKLKLRPKLGNWLVSWHQLPRRYLLYQDHSTHTLYFAKRGFSKERIDTVRHQNVYARSTYGDEFRVLPSSVVPVSATLDAFKLYTPASPSAIQMDLPTQELDDLDSLFDWIYRSNHWLSHLLQDINLHIPEAELEGMLQGALSIKFGKIASDGGCKHSVGTYGWAIRCGGKIIVTGSGTLPFVDTQNSSFRGEAYGVASVA